MCQTQLAQLRHIVPDFIPGGGIIIMNGHHIDFRASEMFSQATFSKCSTATRANENGLIWQWKQGQSGRSCLNSSFGKNCRKFEKKRHSQSFAIQPVRNLFLDRSGNRVHQALHHFCSIAMPVCYPWFRIVALCFVLNLAQRTRCDIHMDCFLSTYTNTKQIYVCFLFRI